MGRGQDAGAVGQGRMKPGLGQDADSELLKMLIQRYCCRRTKIIYGDLACAIGETPPRTGTLLKENPGATNLFDREKANLSNDLIEQQLASFNR